MLVPVFKFRDSLEISLCYVDSIRNNIRKCRRLHKPKEAPTIVIPFPLFGVTTPEFFEATCLFQILN